MSSSLNRDDRDFLQSLGTILTDPDTLAKLPRAWHREELVLDLADMVLGEGARCAVLTGDSGTGKTAIIYELAHYLTERESGWTMVQITPTEFLKGTRYLGEWETQLSRLVNTIASPQKVVLYIPALHEITSIGKSSSSDNNVASALIPHIEQGRIVIIGESSEEALAEGFASNPALKRLFQQVTLKPTDDATTRSIARRVIDDCQLDGSEAFLDRLVELSEFSQAGLENPGRIVGLLRQVLKNREDETKLPGDDEVLSVIEKSTGVSSHLLDDQVSLNLKEVRDFFDRRVIGQPEAVNAAVDLITMIKARLSDPGKPYGVMLFVGPTGVGKTEMARSLAEYCFGDARRLSRIDMSEFAHYDAFERLNGGRGRPGVLTSIVRKQPFSIILLDEIEKAHINVYDLCLQIFDAGRLTDGQGKTADFRRSIIIMTSNVGSQLSDNPAFGFQKPDQSESLSTDIHRELGHTFRPEFLNRIDRVVVFRPLTRDTAERIARLEVERVLKRNGVTGRNLTVDINPDVFPLLLREGYSRTFGARPLKRVIERLLLLPLARKLVTGRVPPESVIHLSARQRQISIEIESPLHDEPPESPFQISELNALDEIRQRVEDLQERSSHWSTRKTNLLARTAIPGFWDNREEAAFISDQIFRLETATRQLGVLRRTINRKATRKLNVDDLHFFELRTRLLELIDQDSESPLFGDAFLTITRLSRKGESQNGLVRIANMYRHWARRYRLQFEPLADQITESPANDSVTFLVRGLGAAAYLNEETGIHELTRKDGAIGDKYRDRVKVDVLPVDEVDGEFQREDISVEVQPLKNVRGRFIDRPVWDVRLVHTPSMLSLRLHTDGVSQSIEERLVSLLAAHVNAFRSRGAGTADDGRIIRIYESGPSAVVRDRRSGVRSGRVEKVFRGHLDRFLKLPSLNGDARVENE
ncbi:AAA family ATPase [Rubinisphaera margarita]|uniref:AAA family ATPase n=1 Tax=Rubinisphaera margarita TaxID=2909586 RepID=UPI001EE809FE|nr:AAA family ATPase [Rubinisphaera margarita]MCG6156048.1 AAA family ATPase [Rubinisphaera margarita]